MTAYRVILGALALVLSFGFSGNAQAEVRNYVLDKPHTQVMFSVDHLGFAKSYGKFLDYDGQIVFNEGEPAKSSVQVTVKTASLDMGDAKWDEHLKSAEFFDVAKFPTMSFKSTGIKVTGEHTASIIGDLTIHGVTKPVTLAVTHNKSGKHPMMDRLETGFSATTTIKRSDFGMGYGVPMVGDEVKIILEVEAYSQDKTGAGTANQ